MHVRRRNLDHFESCHYSAMQAVDPDSGNGEVMIRLPAEAYPLVQGTEFTNTTLSTLAFFCNICCCAIVFPMEVDVIK